MSSMHNPLDPNTVSAKFLAPVLHLLPTCKATRSCPGLTDQDWTKLCLARILHDCRSGRAFLQQYGPALPACPEVGAYFESLKSPRRLRLVQELNGRLQGPLAAQSRGPLQEAAPLRDFECFAGDGHWHGAAAHDQAWDGTKFAMGHFYGLNLRTRGIVHLTSADQLARKKEHDMRALKRLDIPTLRQGTPTGRKVIWVWDKAGIDFRQWYLWKDSAGIYFISCAKENMKLEVVGLNRFEASDPVNRGVQADQLVSTSQGVMVRQVRYRDPVSGQDFEFITNELTLAPGWIAHLYRLRWNIEKVFDDFKNKLSEKKAWASSAVAKEAQAQWLCLAHNLLVLLEAQALVPAGVTNQAEDKRRHQRLEKIKTRLHQAGLKLPQLVETLLQCTQISVKLIRWLRAHFFAPTSWQVALDALRALYAKL